MARVVPENEKKKRAYACYLSEAQGKDVKTVDRALSAVCEFEESTGYKSFKLFRIDQAIRFKTFLNTRRSKKSGKLLSGSTIDVTLRMVKGFFVWLAGQVGYKSKISYADAEYFSNSLKNARAAQTTATRPIPSIEQVEYALAQMPSQSGLEMRNRAIVSIFALTGVRIEAAASLRVKHLVLIQRRLFQDAREVKTKNSKTIDTTFFPVGEIFVEALADYIRHLRTDLLFGPDDPLFPRQNLVRGVNGFQADGLSRAFYSRPAPLNEVVKAAFRAAQFPEYTPHSFRHMLAELGASQNLNPKEFKAWSMNLGHEHVGTTVSSYLKISQNEQREIMQRGWGMPVGRN